MVIIIEIPLSTRTGLREYVQNAKDLGGLMMTLEKKEEPNLIAINASRIIARLHARAIPVEKAKRPLRDIREKDAELAAHCLGVILCEPGWVDWW